MSEAGWRFWQKAAVCPGPELRVTWVTWGLPQAALGSVVRVTRGLRIWRESPSQPGSGGSQEGRSPGLRSGRWPGRGRPCVRPAARCSLGSFQLLSVAVTLQAALEVLEHGGFPHVLLTIVAELLFALVCFLGINISTGPTIVFLLFCNSSSRQTRWCSSVLGPHGPWEKLWVLSKRINNGRLLPILQLSGADSSRGVRPFGALAFGSRRGDLRTLSTPLQGSCEPGVPSTSTRARSKEDRALRTPAPGLAPQLVLPMERGNLFKPLNDLPYHSIQLAILAPRFINIY